jgi:hypothetical protein
MQNWFLCSLVLSRWQPRAHSRGDVIGVSSGSWKISGRCSRGRVPWLPRRRPGWRHFCMFIASLYKDGLVGGKRVEQSALYTSREMISEASNRATP